MIPRFVGQRRWQLARGVVAAGVGPALRAWMRVEHPERLPTGPGPRIVVCNHLAYTDTVRLAAWLPPFVLCGPRPAWLEDPCRRPLLALAQAVPVTDRASFVADVSGLLARGATVLHYPELGRSPDGLGPLVPWALEVAAEVGVPVVPLALRTPRDLAVGVPFRPCGEGAAWLRAALCDLGAPCGS